MSERLPLSIEQAFEQKVRGEFEFLADTDFDGWLQAAVVTSPLAHGYVRGMTRRAALSVPGVVHVVTADDVPSRRFNAACVPSDSVEPAATDMTLLTDHPRFIGDAVAVVVAESREAAEEGAARLVLDVAPEDASIRSATAPVIGKIRQRTGCVPRTVLPELVVEGSFELAAVHHCCLETSSCAATPLAKDEVLVITNNQNPAELRRIIVQTLGTPQISVHVRKFQEGGGFGLKQDMYHEALIAWLAIALQRPVRLVQGRKTEFRSTRVRGKTSLKARLAVETTGQVHSLTLRCLVDSGAYASHTPLVLAAVPGHLHATYPNVPQLFTGFAAQTHTIPAGAYRGYGVAEGCVAVETLLNVAAKKLGISQPEMRRRNLPPLREGRGVRRCLDVLPPIARVDGAPKQGVLHGVGLAVNTKHSVTSVDPGDMSEAVLSLLPGPRVLLRTGTCDSGTGSNRALATIVAEVLGCPRSSISVLEGDSRTGPTDIGSTAQRSIYVGGQAARAVAFAARATLERAGSQMLQRPGVRLEWPQLVSDAGSVATDVDTVVDRSGGHVTVAKRVHAPGIGATYCAVRVGVEIDVVTGSVRVTSGGMAIDCGRVVDPVGARGQAIGGFAQGVGTALIDEWARASDGSGPTTLLEHGVARATDLPDITVHFLDPPCGGVEVSAGLGEAVFVPVAAAVASAFMDATGVRDVVLPLRPATVLRLLETR